MGLRENAKVKLDEAYSIALATDNPTCNHKDFIDYVIDNTHLTFKYILFTELLSKSADERVNTLCLQKGSQLPGAYDARTICHKVIVPFEMEVLNKALGGSNEPFLNKPARFPDLNKSNPVRKGNDQEILDSLCDNLPLIQTSSDAFDCTVYLLWKLIQIREQKNQMTVFSVPETANQPAQLMHYIESALTHSYEGEVLTLMVAGIYHLVYNSDDAVVEVHPVNQCGASSHEISDLDIYSNGLLVSSNELKDKDFAETDVRHAADKVIQAGGSKMLFITGPRSTATGAFQDEIQAEYQARNFMLRIIPYSAFFATMIGSMQNIDVQEFLRFIFDVAHETKFKEEVITYLDSLAQNELNLSR